MKKLGKQSVNKDSPLVTKWLQFSKKYFELKQPALLAVSGGIDSMVMLHLFQEFRFPAGVAHMNFNLRRDSHQDELFVKKTCEALAIPFFSKEVNTREFAESKKVSIEMAARELRYAWLEEIRKKNGYHFIATAHHLDDSVETVLLNTFHGTGIRGLSGIVWSQNRLIRPMLCFFKQEIREIAESNNVAFHEDSTNQEMDFQRNQIRNEIIPSIEKYFPSFRQTMVQNISHWYHARIIYEEAVGRIKKKMITREGETIRISIAKLKNAAGSQTMLFELLNEYGFHEDQLKQIHSALDGEPGKIFYSAGYRLLKDRKNLILSKMGDEKVFEWLVYENDRKIETRDRVITFEKKEAKDFTIPVDSSVCCLDLDVLEFPLIIRRWKKGDYFYPLGMKRKKKKVSDFLIDQKIPLTEKEHVLLAESGKKVACLVARRIDDRFKVLPSTKNIFLIRIKQN